MFVHIRYFAYISTVVVVFAAIALGYFFHKDAAGNLVEIVERNSVSLSQGYINTTWRTRQNQAIINRFRVAEKPPFNIPPRTWETYPEFEPFMRSTFSHFEGVRVTQLSMYMPSGERFLQIDQSSWKELIDNPTALPEPQDIKVKQSDSAGKTMFLSEDDATREVFGKALNGQPASRIVEDAEFLSPSGEQVTGTLIQTFVPITPDDFTPGVFADQQVEVEAIFEMFYDITPQWNQLTQFQIIVTSGIIFLFVALQGALLFVSKMAENLISTQHEEKVELAATAAKAEAESRQKSQFLANVSHELRTPLNAIIGFSEIIKNQVMGPVENEQYMNYISDIHSSGVHLLSLINDILDFSKAEAGKLELQLSELDATKLIKNCMRLVSPRAEEAGVELVTELPKEHFVITGDAKKLKQVLLNLLSNAVKFTPQNGQVKVTAWQNVMDDSISIEVKDSGIGISPKDISRAMSPFGQVDSKLSRKYEGTGLGLPLTKKFVEIMGGTFQIESELNVGTTITITIPLTPPQHVMKSVSKSVNEADDKPREKQISPGLLPKEDEPEAENTDASAGLSLSGQAPSAAPPQPTAPPQPAQTLTPAPTLTASATEAPPAPSAPSNELSLDTGADAAAQKPVLQTPETPTSTATPEAKPTLLQAGAPATAPQPETPPEPAPSLTAQAEVAPPAAPTPNAPPPEPVRPLTAGGDAPAAPVPAPTLTPQEPAAPPPEMPAEAPQPAPPTAPATSSSGTHSFTSYEDLKKMMEQGKKG